MKTGIILYLLGDKSLEANSDIHSEIRKVEPLAEKVEVVGQHTGHFDIADAWWALTAKGMQRIVCMIGEISAAGTLTLKNRILRLCG